MTEASIMQQVYSLYEGDVDDWTSTSDEYLAARRYGNAAINMWEYYDNTKWKELFKKHSATASDVVKTITAGTYTYTTSSDFISPCSYVRTTKNNDSTYYDVLSVADVSMGDDDTGNWVYFTGNPNAGHILNFNPNLTLTTGDTINYEYYKSATQLTATTTVPEMLNPFFIVHYILWRMYKNDGEDGKGREEFQISQQILEQMRTENMASLWNLPFNVNTNPAYSAGFGT